jgi:hypothetical protein
MRCTGPAQTDACSKLIANTLTHASAQQQAGFESRHSMLGHVMKPSACISALLVGVVLAVAAIYQNTIHAVKWGLHDHDCVHFWCIALSTSATPVSKTAPLMLTLEDANMLKLHQLKLVVPQGFHARR